MKTLVCTHLSFDILGFKIVVIKPNESNYSVKLIQQQTHVMRLLPFSSTKIIHSRAIHRHHHRHHLVSYITNHLWWFHQLIFENKNINKRTNKQKSKILISIYLCTSLFCLSFCFLLLFVLCVHISQYHWAIVYHH